ncbi:PDZ domain-containing protein [Alkalicoccobacillus plakortidis]|uniref:PDZ domain-containing protein n=1 Tax=Alkalicoccobacillus plakortidis TaxID=444060 RepID=A0ABT0XIG6_9BACI|nr:PDZ domain-containing protein [Alkalicoccobacillus plakortidis]MCM2675679.1 PDZ domain-containing protein [Alkalicoccobacillus plakortidis]
MEIFQTIMLALGSFFANPLLYVGLLAIYITASKRVRHERSFFHTRVYRRMADFFVPVWPAILIGLCVSLVFVLVGLVISLPVIIIMTAITIILALTLQLRWLTASYAIGLTIIALAFLPVVEDQPFILDYIGVINTELIVPTLALLLSLLVMAEAVLIFRNGSVYTSPRLVRASRGKWIGYHLSERLWIVPILLFIPEGIIPTFEFWPVIPFAGLDLQPLLLPFLIGFKQKVASTIPKASIQPVGKQVMYLGLILLLLSIGSLYVSWLAFVVAGFAIVGREFLWLQANNRDKKATRFFAERADGCTVLGVLPGSLAEKMNIKIGETIVKVNGQKVQDETSFYEALQSNSAFCKLDVLDYDQEVRFEQGALYDSEHHQARCITSKKRCFPI